MCSYCLSHQRRVSQTNLDPSVTTHQKNFKVFLKRGHACSSSLTFPGLSVSVPQSCVLWQEYISATPKEGIRLVEVMDVWASLCTISQINDWLMVWEISKLHRQATHFSCSFPLSLRPSSYALKVCWQKYGLWLRKKKTFGGSFCKFGAIWFF